MGPSLLTSLLAVTLPFRSQPKFGELHLVEQIVSMSVGSSVEPPLTRDHRLVWLVELCCVVLPPKLDVPAALVGVSDSVSRDGLSRYGHELDVHRQHAVGSSARAAVEQKVVARAQKFYYHREQSD
ncbi:hypothetical protein PR003_g25886 [Phytophthora rubi]|uniref:Uncharacterized protein n=1 Tax=Phytophthora rubi TaxID=129364 RepID=A0A6A4CK70_9STRA|nr:hypothetical protein PR003_g25886 [Phytophthora rubi]